MAKIRVLIVDDSLVVRSILANELTKDPDIQVEWGLALQSLGRHAAAIEKFEQGIVLAPDRLESTAHLPTLIEASRTALAESSR